MKLRRFVSPAIAVLLICSVGFAAYRTREQWLPHVFPTAPTEKAGDHHDDHDDHDHGSDRVKLSVQAQKNLALEVDMITPREYWRKIMIPGMVVERPGESDHSVVSRVAGIVIAIKARPGDTVKAGDPLFTIQLASEFLQSVQTDLIKTAREVEFAVVERDRVTNLVKQGTTAEAELVKQQNGLNRLTTQLNGYRRQLQLFGLTADQVNRVENGEVITEVTVAAPAFSSSSSFNTSKSIITQTDNEKKENPLPVLYEVEELKVTLGEQVQPGQTLCLIANHQRLFVEGRAFKSEADALAHAAEHHIAILAEFADEKQGAWPVQESLVIHHLSNQVDRSARTFSFYLSLENQPRTFMRDGKTHFVWRYRPGQRVRLRVPVEKLVTLASDGKTESLPFVLPAGAVVREGAEAYVFVQSGDVFIRKPVHVLYEDRREVVVANDGSITAADFVVLNQAAAINRALKAQAVESGGHDHDHDH